MARAPRWRRDPSARVRRPARQPASKRGYGRDWRPLRDEVLAAEPLCRRCRAAGRTAAAELVDHVIPVEIAPQRRLDPKNLQPLCRPCHGEKTAEDRARYRQEIAGW